MASVLVLPAIVGLKDLGAYGGRPLESTRGLIKSHKKGISTQMVDAVSENFEALLDEFLPSEQSVRGKSFAVRSCGWREIMPLLTLA